MADVEMSDAPRGADTANGKSAEKKKFEVKKWNAVALWAWDIVVDNCAICRNHIMDLCTFAADFKPASVFSSDRTTQQVSSAKRIKHPLRARNALLLGASATMPSISTVFHDG
ncbi:hypothetical protein MY5147_006368 [Beauveria neobassiana]